MHAQSSAPPGPLHRQSERQEIEDLLAPETKNFPVANASSLVNIAVDPSDGRNAVLLGSPFAGQGATAFYVTADGGRRWSTDTIPLLGEFGLTDPYNTTQNTFQYAAGISFNRSGNTLIPLQDPAGHSSVFNGTGDTVGLAEGTTHGRYLNNVPVVATSAECLFDDFCDDALSAQGIVTDLSGTATDGTFYIYYLGYCQNYGSGCFFGVGGSTALFAASSPGIGQPFTYGAEQVSTPFEYIVGGASAVVDSTGTPHFIYTDLTSQPTIGLVLDQAYTPFLQYTQAGQNNTHFLFPGFGSPTPNCAGRGEIAYCAFNAGSLGTGAPQTNVNVYLATIDLQAGTATVSQVNNDAAGRGKDHFNPSVTVTPDGDVFVGFFDDRRHAADDRLDYFVARSTDGGKTFPKQEPINDVSFPVLVGTAPERYSPGFTGSIASGPDGVVHAAWTDTRGGTSVQVYSREVKW